MAGLELTLKATPKDCIPERLEIMLQRAKTPPQKAFRLSAARMGSARSASQAEGQETRWEKPAHATRRSGRILESTGWVKRAASSDDKDVGARHALPLQDNSIRRGIVFRKQGKKIVPFFTAKEEVMIPTRPSIEITGDARLVLNRLPLSNYDGE